MVDLVLDARKLPDFGIGSYVAALLQHVPQMVPSWSLAVLVTPKGRTLLPPLPKKVQVVVVDAPGYSAKEQLALPAKLASLRPRLVHIPHYVVPWFHPWRLVVTVHDLIHLLFPEFLPSPWGFAYATLMMRRALRAAQMVIAVSEATAKDLKALFGADGRKIAVIPNGVDADLFAPAQEQEERGIRAKLGLERPYFLFVGNDKPHKNLETVLKAYQLFVRKTGLQAPNLVLVGGTNPQGPLAEKASLLGLTHKVVILGYLPRNQLLAVYRGALSLVYPSLYEGFGLPVLEAAALGVPAMTSSIPAVREALEDAVLQVNPKDIVEQVQALRRLAFEAETRKRLGEKARARALGFRWEKTVEQTVRVYRQILGEAS